MSTAAKPQTSNKIVHLFAVPRRDLAVEFANTLMWRGSAPAESLHTAGDLVAWLSANRAVPPGALDDLTGWFDAHPGHAATFLRDAIEIRESIYRLLHSVAASSVAETADLRQLNTALRASPPRELLERADGNYGWRIDAKPVAAGILAPVLWSAADVLVGPDAARVRECANHRCLWLFLDDSKNGSRRWCSMQMCGNRAKAQRHYQRHKSK
jgi:predicted RNA-binding Zn ribbon-like protein